MEISEWPADNYKIGSYIQATVAKPYSDNLVLKPSAHVLDIGCGDGSFSTNILKKIPQGQLIGLDRSEKMLRLAKEKIAFYPQLSLQQGDVLNMSFSEQFDYVVSFWCLQWCSDLFQAYTNIHHALKTGAKMMTLLPSGDDPFIHSFQSVKKSGLFPSLNHFVPPIDYEKVNDLSNVLTKIPFKNLKVERTQASILLPSLEIFRKFVDGLPFFYGQLPDAEVPLVNDALIKAYDLHCQENYDGKYWFNFSIYCVRAEK